MVDKPIFEFGGEPGIPINSKDPTLGLFWCIGPSKPPGEETASNRMINLNFTGQPGTASKIYFSLMFQLPKWGLFHAKVDEWIEVTPAHREYYERTMATKQMLEGVIKTGLTSAAQAVADYELINHDLRKYKEIMNYFSQKDEHSLKAMFIDQVDIHTGEGISMRSIVARWPTIIDDFMRLKDEDVEPEKIAKKLDVSRAEAVILATKNKLYKEWKKLFGDAAKERYSTLRSLVEARKRTVQEYRDWLKPYISRFKMTKLAGEKPELRAKIFKSFADITGQSTFANGIRIWAWKPLKSKEPRRPAAEVIGDFIVHPYDDYVRENFILEKNKGLAALYPWLNNDRKYCYKCKSYFDPVVNKCNKCGSIALEVKKVADEIVEKEIIPAWKKKEMRLDPAELYYTFFDIDILRLGTRLQVGELEDITFYIRTFEITQNILLVKILELKCRERELERYIDEILGIKLEERGIEEIVKEEYPELFGKEPGKKTFFSDLRFIGKKYVKPFKKIKKPKIKGIMLMKPGPYERDLVERITKQYLKVSASHFLEMLNFLKQKMGIE
ncbi:MAG: hypothetical protein ACE5J4_01175 [Candidatus Aenigmatarchaeota archaeon]